MISLWPAGHMQLYSIEYNVRDLLQKNIKVNKIK
jgi:hypothetical protein